MTLLTFSCVGYALYDWYADMIYERVLFEQSCLGIPHEDLAAHADYIVEHFYNSRKLKHDCPMVEGKKFPLYCHGPDHFIRVALWCEKFREIYYSLGFRLRDHDFVLLRIAALWHDSGREGDEEDLWETDSAINCYLYMTISMGIESKIAESYAEIIANKDFKDKEEAEYLHFSDIIARSNWTTNARKSASEERSSLSKENIQLMTAILHDADVLDVIRAREYFIIRFLRCFSLLETTKKFSLDVIYSLVHKARVIIGIQGDSYLTKDPDIKFTICESHSPYSIILQDFFMKGVFPLSTDRAMPDSKVIQRDEDQVFFVHGLPFGHPVSKKIDTNPPSPPEFIDCVEYNVTTLCTEKGLTALSLSGMHSPTFYNSSGMLFIEPPIILSSPFDLGTGGYLNIEPTPEEGKVPYLLEIIISLLHGHNLSDEAWQEHYDSYEGQVNRFINGVDVASWQEVRKCIDTKLQQMYDTEKDELAHVHNFDLERFHHGEAISGRLYLEHLHGFYVCLGTPYEANNLAIDLTVFMAMYMLYRTKRILNKLGIQNKQLKIIDLTDGCFREIPSSLEDVYTEACHIIDRKLVRKNGLATESPFEVIVEIFFPLDLDVFNETLLDNLILYIENHIYYQGFNRIIDSFTGEGGQQVLQLANEVSTNPKFAGDMIAFFEVADTIISFKQRLVVELEYNQFKKNMTAFLANLLRVKDSNTSSLQIIIRLIEKVLSLFKDIILAYDDQFFFTEEKVPLETKKIIEESKNALARKYTFHPQNGMRLLYNGGKILCTFIETYLFIERINARIKLNESGDFDCFEITYPPEPSTSIATPFHQAQISLDNAMLPSSRFDRC